MTYKIYSKLKNCVLGTLIPSNCNSPSLGNSVHRHSLLGNRIINFALVNVFIKGIVVERHQF